MSVDDDLKQFNQGFDELFKPKPISHIPPESIKHEEQKTPWQRKRTKRTQSDTYTMVCSYNHHEGDRKWLVEQLQILPQQKREAAMMQYEQMYNQVHNTEQAINKRDGQARRASNLWLMKLIEKLSKQ